jgi:hypothetical protein
MFWNGCWAGHSVFTELISSVLRYSGKFGSLETGTDRFLKNSVPRVFGIGKFGSVPVLTERYRIYPKEGVIACSKTNFDMIS